MELAVAFEFKLDIVVAVDGELGCKFRAFLALESGETIMVEANKMIDYANKHDIIIMAF